MQVTVKTMKIKTIRIWTNSGVDLQNAQHAEMLNLTHGENTHRNSASQLCDWCSVMPK